MERLPDNLPDSIRRSVKSRCPCAAATIGDCFCRTCKNAVFLLKDDDYIYCNCGRYRSANAAFKCLDPTHGNGYLTYEDSEMLQEAYEYQEFEQHNILLLGEAGVGKSTFINAFMNYMLFETLDEALAAPNFNWAIPSAFRYTETNDEKLEPITVTFCEETEAQKYSLDGQSATRSCVTYVLHMNGLTLRLINTPGIGDTRGHQQDRENINDILRTLKSIENISTILFLVKPNLARLGQVFDSRTTELLSHFHKEANQNFVFGFTSSRSADYSLGDTAIPLQKFLRDNEIDIDVDYDNTFFFDSEGFRYLAAYRTMNKEMKDKVNFVKSFQNSAEEARRLVKKIIRTTAHEVRKTLSLSDTRLSIERLKNLIIVIEKRADEVQQEIEKQKGRIEELETSNSALEDNLKMTVQKPVKRMLPSPRTVCTDNKCRIVNRDADGKEQVVYKQICHDYCYIKTTDELVGAPEISTCEVFDFSSKPCSECGHEWDRHQHISYTITIEEVEIENPTILGNYYNNKFKLERAQAAIESLARKKEQLKESEEFIICSLASFEAYLSSTAMVRYSDAETTCPEYLINNDEKEDSDNSQRQFEEQFQIYKEQYNETTQGNPKLDLPSKVPGYDEIMEIRPNRGES
jgi:septin family protein